MLRYMFVAIFVSNCKMSIDMPVPTRANRRFAMEEILFRERIACINYNLYSEILIPLS